MAEESILDEIERYINEEKIEGKVRFADPGETSVGRKMAYCRRILFFSKKEMANIFEITPRQLSNYEKDISSPPLKTLLLYAQYFEIPMEDFVDDYISMQEFSLKYCLFHFIKFKIVYKFMNNM